MKNVGIVTFYTAINYGVHLQAFALQEAVSQMGYESVIVNYPHHKANIEKDGILKRLFSKLKKINRLASPDGIKRFLYMRKFRNSEAELEKKKSFQLFTNTRFRLTPRCESMQDVIEKTEGCSSFICGSDQIWNPNYTECNPVFFLQFAPKNTRIAYAPSVGVSSIPKELSGKYKEFLDGFLHISARESTGASLISNLTGHKCLTVVDPTLLHDTEFWNHLSSDQVRGEEYVLIYFLGFSPLHKKVIDRLKTLTSIKIVNIPICYETASDKSFEQVHASIAQFLSLIRDAKFVLTDSFHGVAFSVNYRKNFYAVSRNDTKYSLNSRIADFLNKISLNDRVIYNDNVSDYKMSEIDYSETDELLCSWVNESKEYLSSSLAEATKNVYD